jgi:predicted Holliday junction resolvase-like endonuclease
MSNKVILIAVLAVLSAEYIYLRNAISSIKERLNAMDKQIEDLRYTAAYSMARYRLPNEHRK